MNPQMGHRLEISIRDRIGFRNCGAFVGATANVDTSLSVICGFHTLNQFLHEPRAGHEREAGISHFELVIKRLHVIECDA